MNNCNEFEMLQQHIYRFKEVRDKCTNEKDKLTVDIFISTIELRISEIIFVDKYVNELLESTDTFANDIQDIIDNPIETKDEMLFDRRIMSAFTLALSSVTNIAKYVVSQDSSFNRMRSCSAFDNIFILSSILKNKDIYDVEDNVSVIELMNKYIDDYILPNNLPNNNRRKNVGIKKTNGRKRSPK